MKKNKSGKESRKYWVVKLTVLSMMIGKVQRKCHSGRLERGEGISHLDTGKRRYAPGRGKSKSMAPRKERVLVVKGTTEVNVAETE